MNLKFLPAVELSAPPDDRAVWQRLAPIDLGVLADSFMAASSSSLKASRKGW